MPPKATKDMVFNFINLATKHFNFLFAQKTGFAFLSMKLLDFPFKINLLIIV